MPYIKKKDRVSVITDGPTNAGELNYTLTNAYILHLAGSTFNYSTLNNIIGALDNALSIFLDDGMFDPGRDSSLTLTFSRIITGYVERQCAGYEPDVRDDVIGTVRDDVVGSVRCCQLELYRRIISPYEETKIRENGDVFPLSVLTPK